MTDIAALRRRVRPDLHLHAPAHGVVGLGQQTRGRLLIDVLLAADLADLSWHFAEYDRNPLPLKCDGDLARRRLTVFADVALHLITFFA